MAISEKEKKLIGELCERIGALQTTVLKKRAEQIAEYLHELSAQEELPQQLALLIESRMCEAMREADKTFERVGGNTRHHVVGCLMPILSKHGLKLVAIEKSI